MGPVVGLSLVVGLALVVGLGLVAGLEQAVLKGVGTGPEAVTEAVGLALAAVPDVYLAEGPVTSQVFFTESSNRNRRPVPIGRILLRPSFPDVLISQCHVL